MRTNNLFRKTLIAAGFAAAFATVPFAQVAAQDAARQDAAQRQQDAAAMRQTQDAAAMHDKQSSNETVPGKTNDAWITTKIKSELATTKGIKSTDISVDTKDGMVTLTGTATSAGEKAKAEHVAKQVKGVKTVDASGLMVSDAAH
ncbi:transporter [Dyella jiangningensis]|jgi:hyperosmotically inducible protein|uniref:BON domain-containing protein n=1 Tax=Dyella jiangningensis TaxID=1379159 RepID=UPI000456397C|nr:BON domain-containing protein [Dyella jiangningensis]AHX12219.1 transporter [Dyella jiangningensis]MDG2537109.1 BON domain-containing protein [Dyella jiangningensis]